MSVTVPSRSNYNETRQAALAVGVKPPSTRAPLLFKRLAWRIEKLFLKVVTWLDPCSPPDSKLSLRVLWWKAIAANDVSSPVFESTQLTNEMLPWGIRWLVKRPFNILYPRWTHVIVEIRTAYLNQVITRIRNNIIDDSIKLRLVYMGAGYDVRSIRLLMNDTINEAIELDLPQVVDAKQRMLKRLVKRRPNVTLPLFRAVNLTDLALVEATLVDILSTQQDVYTIFLFEGVLMYLPEGIPTLLLQACRQALHDTRHNGCIVFADALEHIPNDDEDTARQELSRLGWNLIEWQPKGGRTRHMGCAVATMEG